MRKIDKAGVTALEMISLEYPNMQLLDAAGVDFAKYDCHRAF